MSALIRLVGIAVARRNFGQSSRIVLGTAALLAFVGLASEMLEGETLGFDRAALLALRDPADHADPIGPLWLKEVARDVTGLGGAAILTLITMAVANYLVLVRKWADGLFILVAVVGGTGLSTLLKYGFNRPRPDLVPHAVEVYSASFPSGHAMLSAVTYLTLGALVAREQPRWRIKTYVIASAATVTLLVGVSRVYLGVHWPTDVLGGWCVGAAWALLCWVVSVRLQYR